MPGEADDGRTVSAGWLSATVHFCASKPREFVVRSRLEIRLVRGIPHPVSQLTQERTSHAGRRSLRMTRITSANNESTKGSFARIDAFRAEHEGFCGW